MVVEPDEAPGFLVAAELPDPPPECGVYVVDGDAGRVPLLLPEFGGVYERGGGVPFGALPLDRAGAAGEGLVAGGRYEPDEPFPVEGGL